MTFDVRVATRQRMPGWRVAVEHASEPGGELVTVERFDPQKGGLVERTVWIPVEGEPVEAHIDGRGYIVTSDGRRF